MKNTTFFYFFLVILTFSFLQVNAQQTWESVVLEDAFANDNTGQPDVIQGAGKGNLYIKGIDSWKGNRETFIKLSLDILDNLSSTELTDAKVELRIYSVRTNIDAEKNQISIFPLSNEWKETELTWTNSRTISQDAVAAGAISSGGGRRIATYSGTGQQGQPTDEYNVANETRFDISAYAVQQYKANNKTISLLLKVTNIVNNGDQQLASKDLATTVPGYELKLPKLIVSKPSANADFSAPTIGLINEPVQFTNKSSLATTYLWNFGDGSTSTEKDPVHTYIVPGTYEVTLSINGSTELVKKTAVTIYKVNDKELFGGNFEFSDKSSWAIVGENTFTASGGAEWGVKNLAGFGTDGYLNVWDTGATGTQYYIWQAVKLTAGEKYELSYDYAIGEHEKSWFETFIGKTMPGGSDYSDNKVYSASGLWSLGDKGNTPAKAQYTFEPLETGIYFYVIKAGSNGGGKINLSIDNVKLSQVSTGVEYQSADDSRVFVKNSRINIESDSSIKNVRIFSITGQLIQIANLTNSEKFESKILKSGIFILDIDSKSYKIIVE